MMHLADYIGNPVCGVGGCTYGERTINPELVTCVECLAQQVEKAIGCDHSVAEVRGEQFGLIALCTQCGERHP